RREIFEYLNIGSGRECAVGFIRGCAAKIVEAVGEHADLDSRPVDAQSAFVDRLLDLRRGCAISADARVGRVEQQSARIIGHGLVSDSQTGTPIPHSRNFACPRGSAERETLCMDSSAKASSI